MESSNSITRCLAMLKQGDREAADRLWAAYLGRLLALARAKHGGPRGVADGPQNEPRVALGCGIPYAIQAH